VARCPAILIAGGIGARARSGAMRLARPLETCSGCPVTTTGWIASRHVKGQRADDPRAEPANSHPPGLATTMRMAARPSKLPAADAHCTLRSLSCFQYTPVSRVLELPLSALFHGSLLSGPGVVHFAARQSCYSPHHVAVIDVHSFGFTYPGAQRPAIRGVAFTCSASGIVSASQIASADDSTDHGLISRASGCFDCRQKTMLTLG